MIAYERSESTRDNFGKFIHQFQPKYKTLIRKLERILIKLYRQNVSLLFNQTCLNERLLPNYTSMHTHTHTHTYIKNETFRRCILYINIDRFLVSQTITRSLQFLFNVLSEKKKNSQIKEGKTFCLGDHWRTSLMCLSLLSGSIQHVPFVLLQLFIWWTVSYLTAALLLSAASGICRKQCASSLSSFFWAFSSNVLLDSKWCSHTQVLTWLLLERIHVEIFLREIRFLYSY